jgi:glycosyltransferase involved in cell wall biosynthesis
LHQVNAGSCNLNDVAAGPLLRFELNQLPRAWALHQGRRFDVVHRVTPSWIGNGSLLPTLQVPFVIGPLLAAERPPESFAAYLNGVIGSRSFKRLHPRRVVAGLASRLRNWSSRGQRHLRTARKILTGNRVAFQCVPKRWQSRCEQVPYSGVEHDFFVPPLERLRNKPLRLLYVGRLVPYKGVELLLRAVAIAARRCEISLRIAGTGSETYGNFCKRLAKDLALDQQVDFISSMPRFELLGLYQETEIFCFPSLCDTYGVALLEAMSCGCAIVASDAAGPREILTDGTGITVPLRNPEQFIREFADGIVTLSNDSRLRDKLGVAARARVIEHHNWESISQQLLKVYEEL